MMSRLGNFLRDRRGATAIEFAFIAPLLGVGAVVLYDIWSGAAGNMDIRGAVNAGAHYAMNGGASDDTTTKNIIMSAWPNKPKDASVSISRSCMCATSPSVCTGLCTATRAPPQVYVTLTATGTGTGGFMNTKLTQTQVVRVR